MVVTSFKTVLRTMLKPRVVLRHAIINYWVRRVLTNEGRPTAAKRALAHAVGYELWPTRCSCRPRLWSCKCGWTNTNEDTTCQRCGMGQVDGYGFRI